MGRMMILIVEDVDVTRRLIVRVLERHGHVVAQARDGLAARTLLENTAFDAMLLDLSLPGMSGLELLRWQRTRESESQWLGKLPIAVVTGYTDLQHRTDAYNAGANEVFSKSVDTGEIVEWLDKYFR